MKYYLIGIFSILMATATAQEKHIVTSEGGLFVRSEPNTKSTKIDKLPFAFQVEIKEQTKHQLTITENGKEITANWVKVNFDYIPNSRTGIDSGYVFSGFLKKKDLVVEEMEQKLRKYDKYNGFGISDIVSPFYLKGDFFGDGVSDLLIMVEDTAKNVKIAIIDYGGKTNPILLGSKADQLYVESYDWVGVLAKVNRGEVLFSNYTDDFRSLEDVPENEKVYLNYDAFYVHAAESCGGGFIFWKDNKFNWLQQE